MLSFQIDVRLITMISLSLGYITNVYVGLLTLIGFIPIIGLIIVNILTMPFIWLVNSFGYVASLVAIKKSYKQQVFKHRMMTLILVIGIIMGYILSYLIPLK